MNRIRFKVIDRVGSRVRVRSVLRVRVKFGIGFRPCFMKYLEKKLK